MSAQAQHFYEFGPFRIDEANHLLLRHGQVVALKPKAFDTLLVLVENRGQVLEKEKLMERLWPDSFVEESNLTQTIYTLRKVLGEASAEHHYIETIPKRGYRFVADVKASVAESADERVKERETIRSIAVLPFRPLLTEERDEYLELGIADALITALSSTRQIIMRPTNAVRRFTDPHQDPIAAGRELKVEAVLEGSIQKSGDRIRITARLVRVSDAVPLWADKFDGKFTDIFTVQDSISEKVVKALALNLTSEEKRQLAKRHTENTEAYQLYLKGRYYWQKWTPEGWKKSIECLKQAIEKDPAHAPSYSWMAASYCTLGIFGVLTPREGFTKATALVKKALALDDTLSEAHEVMGAVKLFYEWEWPETEGVLRRAIELNPSNAGARDLYALYLTATGRPDEAITEVKRAQDIDPLSLLINTDVGNVLYWARRYDQAIEQLQKTLELDPYFAHARYALGYAYLQKAMCGEGIAEINKAITFSGREAETSPVLGYAYAVSGQRIEARKVLDALRKRSKHSYVDPYQIALIYIGLDDQDQAFTCLRQAYKERSRELIYLKANPVCDRLRSDPRFTDLLRRIGLTP